MTRDSDRTARLEKALRRKRALRASAEGARSDDGATKPTAAGPAVPRRPADRPAVLGSLQRGLWLAHRLDPDSAAYHLVGAFRVHGALDVARLGEALSTVVSRHRILRSTFRPSGETVHQDIADPAPVPIRRIRAAPGEARAAAVRFAREPFDLETGPLVRAASVEEPDDGERLFLLVLPHLLADERSLEILWGELAVAWEGGLGPAPEIQLDDWNATEARSAADREAERRAAIDAWRARLDPLPSSLRLLFERPLEGRPPETAGPRPRGRLFVHLPAAPTATALRDLAARAGSTPFAVGAFAFRILLDRWTQGRSAAFATPVSRRTHPATAEMVGYLLDPVVVTARVDEDLPALEALRQFDRELRETLAAPAVPFAELVEALRAPRTAGRPPLVQAMFVLREPGSTPRLGEAVLEPLDLDLGESKLDLTLFLTVRDSGVELAIEFRTDLFEEASIRALLEQAGALLAGLVESPGRSEAELTLVPADVRDRLATFSRGPALEGADPRLLPERISAVLRERPDAVAVVAGGVERTRADLDGVARRVAGTLAEAGIGRGDRVALFLPRSADLIAALVGVQRSGAAYVPLDPGYPPERNRLVLEDAEVAAVVTATAVGDRLPKGGWHRIDVERGGVSDASDSAAADRPVIDSVRAEDPAYLLFTSGSTGRPKGVVVDHGNLRASNEARLAFYGERGVEPRRFLLIPSVAFDSSVVGIFWMLAGGGALVIPSDSEARDPRALVRRVRDDRVDGLLCVPSLWSAMLAADPDALVGLRVAIAAGEVCPRRLVGEHFRRLPDTRLFNEYGPTECTVWATVAELGPVDAGADGPISIGNPIPGVVVDVLDDRGRRVPEEMPGAAFVAGPTVARGYWRRDDETAERFDRDPRTAAPRYRTGDRMAWRRDGALLFLGREDEQVQLRGLRVEPAEIEAAVLDVDGVAEVAAVVRPLGGPDRPEGIVAFVRTDGVVDPEWTAVVGRRLPEAMVPSRLVVVDDLPRLPNGKVDREALASRELRAEAPSSETETVRIPSLIESGLVSLWEGLLGTTGLGLHDNFFRIGGHSLLAVELATAIERDIGEPIEPADVFAHPTVEGLARRIEAGAERSGPRWQHLFPLQPGGEGDPMVVAIPHFFAETFARRFRGERPVVGLRGIGLRPEGNLGRWKTLEELAEESADEIESRFPRRDCLLAGYSFGASMAVEVARVLESRGRAVHRLIPIAPMPLDLVDVGPLRLQLPGLDRPAADLAPGRALATWVAGLPPWRRSTWQRIWRRTAVEARRRAVCAVGRRLRSRGRPLSHEILWADVRVDRFRLHARYRPAPLAVPTTFLDPEDAGGSAFGTWRDVFTGPVEVVEVPDPHGDDTAVERAKAVLREVLDRVEAP